MYNYDFNTERDGVGDNLHWYERSKSYFTRNWWYERLRLGEIFRLED